MEILFVVPYVPSLIRVRPYHLIRELGRRNNVSLLAVDSPRTLGDVEPLRALLQSVGFVPLRLSESLRSCARGVIRGDPLQAAVCQSPQLSARLTELLTTRQFDVVHVEHLRAAALGGEIPRHIPKVFDAVDSISLLLRRTLRSSYSPRQRIVAAIELHRTAAFERRMLGVFDRTVVTSPDDMQALHALARDANITVIPNGVDLEYFRPLDTAPEPATLVLSGKMSYHANATAALYFVQHILPLIRAARPDTRLRIAGSNPPKAVQGLAADPLIEVTGHVADLRQFIGSATVAVCPVTVKVGIQNKLLEAMAMGVPVVATGLGAEGLLAEPGRDFLVGNSPGEFAEHVTRLIEQPLEARRIGDAGRRYVERSHRWDTAARRFEELYAAAAAGHKPSA